MGFTYAAVYQVQAMCRTPLRTSGADGDVEQVLRRRDGVPFVQGTSLAGALRNYLEQGVDASLSGELFGNQEQTGHLIVSDALFARNSEQVTRPRLRIDPASATGEDGGKFDVAHIRAGSKLAFTLVWQGTPEQKKELDAIERLLGAMNAIRLGAQKSNGFGQLSLTVKRALFDLTRQIDRKAWLEENWDGEPLEFPEVKDPQRVLFTLTGRTGSILVKDASVLGERDGKTSAYTPNLFENGQAVLPGSSIKGAVRGRAAYIAKILGLGEDVINRFFGRSNQGEDNGLPGQIWFEDAALTGHKRKISRIRIDRFTGGVQRQGLFTEEPLSSALTLRISVPEEPVPCALLVYALRDLGLGLYTLGSGWAIGRGKVEVENIQITAPGGKRAALHFDSQGKIDQDDSDQLLKSWLETLEEVRHAV